MQKYYESDRKERNEIKKQFPELEEEFDRLSKLPKPSKKGKSLEELAEFLKSQGYSSIIDYQKGR